ncbi:MAG TPA: peptidylprolyl isomerase [Rudaea sp.]|nr:peptidylprolyl isomerase [Rudaea sp.]
MRFSVFFLIACGLVACGVGAATPASAQTPFKPETVVVSRGGVQITFQDIDEYMQHVPADKRAPMMDSPKRIEALLLTMLLNRQLVQQALEMKLDSDPEVQGKTGWERSETLARLRMERFMKDLKVPDFEVLAHEEYIAHKDHYTARGARTVQRIFISSKTLGEKDAWNHAAEVRGEALAAPDQFEALVAKYSDDPDKAQTHGVLVDSNIPKADKWLPEAVQSLHKPGDISDVYSAPGGYQIVKLVSAEPDVLQPFSAVRDHVIAQLRTNYIETQRRDFLDQLGSEKLDANPEAVASLRIRYASSTTAAPAKDAAGAGHSATDKG